MLDMATQDQEETLTLNLRSWVAAEVAMEVLPEL